MAGAATIPLRTGGFPMIVLGSGGRAGQCSGPRMTTVLETIDGGTRYLEKRGIEDARRNMQMLVARQLGCTRMDLYLQFDRPLQDETLAPLRELLKKRGEGVPLQHLLGTVGFHRHEFNNSRSGASVSSWSGRSNWR